MWMPRMRESLEVIETDAEIEAKIKDYKARLIPVERKAKHYAKRRTYLKGRIWRLEGILYHRKQGQLPLDQALE